VRGVAIALSLALVQTACLQQTHRIPRGELMRLSQTAPEQRGEHVRVIQELGGEQPPRQDPVTAETEVTIVYVPDIQVSVGGGHRPAPRPPDGVKPGGSGGGKGGGVGGLADMKSDEAWVIFVIAATAAIFLAATEGARYDGWVRLHPMHPVHLWGPGGYAVMPLAHIDPATAAWAERAVVRDSEGPWDPLGRAPLDRAGWTYTVLLGAATSTSADESTGAGTSGRVQLGYFPAHQFGLQLDWGFSVRDNAVGETLFDNRLGLEATVAPFDAGRLHAGVYGGIALASRFEDGVRDGRDDDTALSGGAILQLGWTTRLAVTGRFGVSRAYGDIEKEALLGLSIY
jgi:hypothetical protein